MLTALYVNHFNNPRGKHNYLHLTGKKIETKKNYKSSPQAVNKDQSRIQTQALLTLKATFSKTVHICLKKKRWWASNCLVGEKNKLFYAWHVFCTFPSDLVRNCITSYFHALARWMHSSHLNLQSKCHGTGSMEILSLVFQSIADVTRTELSEQLLIK